MQPPLFNFNQMDFQQRDGLIIFENFEMRAEAE